MRHPNDESLLRSILQLDSELEQNNLQQHLRKCAICQTRIFRLRKETELIGSLELNTQPPVLPLPRPRHAWSAGWVKAALLLVTGFLAGFYLAQQRAPHPVRVIPQALAPVFVEWTPQQFTVSDPVDLAVPPPAELSAAGSESAGI